jgi:hypothetical protein
MCFYGFNFFQIKISQDKVSHAHLLYFMQQNMFLQLCIKFFNNPTLIFQLFKLESQNILFYFSLLQVIFHSNQLKIKKQVHIFL